MSVRVVPRGGRGVIPPQVALARPRWKYDLRECWLRVCGHRFGGCACKGRKRRSEDRPHLGSPEHPIISCYVSSVAW